MKSQCPRCGNSMGETQEASNITKGMDVKGCTKCGGFLIDYSDAEGVISDAVTHFEDKHINDVKPEPSSSEPLKGACPFCGGGFEPAPLGFDKIGKAINLDQCTKCQGIWFDKGELGQIFEYAMKEAIADGTLDEDINETFSKTVAYMDCPRCGSETIFGKGEILGIEVDKCRKCRGVWLDQGDIEAFTGGLKPETSEEKTVSHGGKPAKGGCPKCKIELLKWNNAPEKLKDLYIDFCPQCLGMWFDKGELAELLKLFALSPYV